MVYLKENISIVLYSKRKNKYEHKYKIVQFVINAKGLVVEKLSTNFTTDLLTFNSLNNEFFYTY